ncbi:hypothetical protein ElyMa_003986300 [Elysia marginata]|uniref:Uncharacterized protein n=1 Tax=Elysia marginata TaxID=1093978 RepID=A0AAV4G0A8_9GAST|nr:hypothetical protein ElyMa_003986300 [Elysia marginata]
MFALATPRKNIHEQTTGKTKEVRGGRGMRLFYGSADSKVPISTEISITRHENIWIEESIEALQACFDWTDWGVFVDSCGDLEEVKDTVYNYKIFL